MSWRAPIRMDSFDHLDPVIRGVVMGPLRLVAEARLAWPRVYIEVEGEEHLGDGDCVVCMNHTHYLDWLPVRLVLGRKGRKGANLVKPRTYQHWAMAAFLAATGNIPISSRGYVITADAREHLGIRLEEAEYRHLRDLVDGKPTSTEPTDRVKWLLDTPRDLLGHAFDPTSQPYPHAVNHVFGEMTRTTARLAGGAMRQGCTLTITPQGVFSSRLTPGRPGAVQFASYLDKPVVPCGLSGMREVFVTESFNSTVGGTLNLRFGPPMRVQLPEGHLVFDKASEDRHRAALDSVTSEVMEAINSLVDPRYQWDDDPEGDGVKGTQRFL